MRPGRRLAPLDLVQGFAEFWLSAIRLLTRPEFFGRLGAAGATNAAAMAVIAAGVWWGLVPLAHWLAASDWGWLEPARDSLGFARGTQPFVLTVVLAVLIVPAVLQTLTAPFLEPLAEAVERSMGIGSTASAAPRGLTGITANVRASAQVLAMQLVVLVPCVLLSFCHLGLAVALCASAFLNALLWFELPFARRGASIEQRVRTVRRNWPRALGFGLAFQVALLTPFFNLLLLAPTAAVAVSSLYLRFDKLPSLAQPAPRSPARD